MRSIFRLSSLAVLLFFFSCNVDNLSESNLNLDNQLKEDGGCETAFGYYEDGCFLDDDFNRWGWTIGPLSEGFSGSFDIYAGAGQCKLVKGELVGTLNVEYSEGSVSVEYSMMDGKCLYESHLYVGNEEYPTNPAGKPTVAPGQYGNQNQYEDGVSSDSYTIDNLSGDIYIIAHAVVCDCPVECVVDAGSLKAEADSVCLDDGTATISALSGGDAIVPDGYEVLYVLTEGQDLVIQAVSSDPSFVVDAAGSYTIHTLVYDPNTLDLSIVEFGVTTGFDVYGLLIDGGGDICAALDVKGAPVTVEPCEEECTAFAGTITADAEAVCLENGTALLTATPDGNAVVPDGYEVIYVLTKFSSLTIFQVSTEPSFVVDDTANYRIHTLVYDPNTLDLGIVQFGVTTGADVYGNLIEGGGDICGSLDVAGAAIKVILCE